MAPSAMAARAGTGVTRALEGAIGSEGAKSLAGKIVQSAVPMAAGSAVEGAVYSAGNVLSEASLGDPQLNAEKALAQVGMGAALGGGIGGLVGAVAAPFRKNVPHLVSQSITKSLEPDKLQTWLLTLRCLRNLRKTLLSLE